MSSENENNEAKTTNSIKLLGINKYHRQLKFNEQISILCSKTAMQLNVFDRLEKYTWESQKNKQLLTAIINHFFTFVF